jgi:methionine-rich copper-binding protein CopC
MIRFFPVFSPTGARRLVAALGLLVAAVLCLPAAPAAAHNTLLSTSPTDGEQLSSPPSEIKLVFNDDVIEIGTEMAVGGPSGPVAIAKPVINGATVTAALPPDLAAGEYTVQWRVTSADGHPISGTFSFGTQAPAAAPATTAPEPTATAAATDTATPSPAATAADSAAGGGGGSSGPLIAVIVLAAAVVAGLTALVIRRRST